MKRIVALGLAGISQVVTAGESPAFRTLEDGFGPLMVRSESPIQALRLTPMPRAPVIPASGQQELRAAANVSSIWIKDADYFLDLHLADMRIALLWGLTGSWAVEMAINERRVVNAHLDNITVAFHDIFGIDQNGRDEVPMNDTRISFPTYGIELGDRYRKAFSRAIEGALIKKVANQDGRWPAVAISASIRYEMLEDGPVPQGSMDYSVEVNLGKRLGKNFVYGSLGYTYFDTSHFFSMPLKDTQRTGMLAYERHVGKNSALVVQYLYGEGVAIDLGELSDASHEIIFGYKWLRSKVLWEFALTENIINFNNSPDFGLTAGFSYRF